MNKQNKKDLWIGLARVKQPPGISSLGDADGAYVNVLTLASNSLDFRSQIKEALEELGLELSKLEDAETMIRRLSKHSINEALQELSEEVRRTGTLRFDVFQTFDLDH